MVLAHVVLAFCSLASTAFVAQGAYKVPQEFQWKRDLDGARPHGFSLSPTKLGVFLLPFMDWADKSLFEKTLQSFKTFVGPKTAKIVSLIAIHHGGRFRFEDSDAFLPLARKDARCQALANKVLLTALKEGDYMVGYNYIYCPLNRTMYGGREWKGAIPSATPGQNGGTIAVLVLGQYSEDPDDIQNWKNPNKILPHMVKDLAALSAWLGQEWDLSFDPNAQAKTPFLVEPVHPLTCHRELALRHAYGRYFTSCPGDRLRALLPAIRDFLQSPPPSPVSPWQ